MDDMQLLFDLVQSVGIWGIFVWLYVKEKASHEETRKQYREDLREMAGIRPNLSNMQRMVTQTQTQPIPEAQNLN